MTGEVGAHTNRLELVAVRGYDTRYAMHALRLGYQGIELLTTGRITLPVPEPDRAFIWSVRSEVSLPDAVDAARAKIGRLAGSSSLPYEPDRRWVDDWLHRSHVAY